MLDCDLCSVIGNPCLYIMYTCYTCETQVVNSIFTSSQITCFITPVHKHVYFFFFSMLICRFKMPNQTQLHNMRCKKSTSVGTTGNENKMHCRFSYKEGTKGIYTNRRRKKAFQKHSEALCVVTKNIYFTCTEGWLCTVCLAEKKRPPHSFRHSQMKFQVRQQNVWEMAYPKM